MQTLFQPFPHAGHNYKRPASVAGAWLHQVYKQNPATVLLIPRILQLNQDGQVFYKDVKDGQMQAELK